MIALLVHILSLIMFFLLNIISNVHVKYIIFSLYRLTNKKTIGIGMVE